MILRTLTLSAVALALTAGVALADMQPIPNPPEKPAAHKMKAHHKKHHAKAHHAMKADKAKGDAMTADKPK